MILVLADHDRGVLDPLSLQALSAARALDPQVDVVLVGAAGREAVAELSAYGAATVHLAVHDALTDYAPQASARAVLELVTSLSPRAVLTTGSPRGNEVLAHVAAILDVPFAADCVVVTPSVGGVHEVQRNRWGGNLLETARVHSDLLVASFAPHAVRAEPADGPGTVVEFTPSLNDADTAVRVLDRTGEGAAGVGLAEARVIVSGGRGVGGPEGFATLEELAELLDGAIGCSRVVTSNGWRPHNEQVGQTGTKVAPDLYIAAGISGATQHIAGMRTSKTIVAINTDKDAPIMGYAHYAVVGDLHTILPALVAATRAAKE
jgi:electron transfer flavoprotein alpha subunit